MDRGQRQSRHRKMCSYLRWEETRRTCIVSVSSMIINFNYIIWMKKWHLFPGLISWNLSNVPTLFCKKLGWNRNKSLRIDACMMCYSYKRWHPKTWFLKISRKENVYGNGLHISLAQLEWPVRKRKKSELLADLVGSRMGSPVLTSLAVGCDALWGRVIPCWSLSLTSGDINGRNCQSGLNWLPSKFAPVIDHNEEKTQASELHRVKTYTEEIDEAHLILKTN